MTIKIQAFQRNGIKTEDVQDEFEFCCWKALKKWLNGYSSLHSCPECKKEIKEGVGEQ